MAHKLRMKFEGTVKRVRKEIRTKMRKNKEEDARNASQKGESRRNAEQELG